DFRPQCFVDPGERTACAGSGVTPAECAKKGCCFSSARSDSIWCYKTKADVEMCAVENHNRIACAGSGVTAAQCKAKGCCFNSSRWNTIWCFKPKSI
ncbi:hypothetical protein FKM82_025045, partial [Ascaphus truei]